MAINTQGLTYTPPNLPIGKITKQFYPPSANCKLYLPMYPPGSTTVVYDQSFSVSGTTNNGTLTGGVWSRLASGQNILTFDGDDKVNFGNVNNVTTEDFYLEMWCAMAALTANGDMFIKRTGNVGYGMQIKGDGSFAPFIGDADSFTATAKGSGYDDGVWRHYALSFDRDATVNYLVNGASIGTTSITGEQGSISCAGSLYIGVYSDGAQEWLLGKWALARIGIGVAPATSFFLNHYQRERHLFGV